MKRKTTFANEASLTQHWDAVASSGVSLPLDDGGHVYILSPGERNHGSGPDYVSAVLLLNGELRTGDIELHVVEDDWFKHGHNGNCTYSNVILHVVAQRSQLRRASLPTLVLQTELEVGSDSCRSVDTTAQLSSLLQRLSWERLMRMVSESRSTTSDASGPSDLEWLIRRLCSILGRAADGATMTAFGANVERLVRMDSAARWHWHCCGGYIQSQIEKLADRPCGLEWRMGARPVPSRSRRIAAIGGIVQALVAGDLMAEVARGVVSSGIDGGAGALVTGSCGLGLERRRTIVFDCFVPLLLSRAISGQATELMARLLRAWRMGPTLGTNRVLRAFERRFLGLRRLRGAFWQAGALEYERRFGTRALDGNRTDEP